MAATYQTQRDAALADPAVYFWAKDLIRLLDGKDVLDGCTRAGTRTRAVQREAKRSAGPRVAD